MRINYIILLILGVLGLIDQLTTSIGHDSMMEFYQLDIPDFGLISAFLFEIGLNIQRLTGLPTTGLFSGFGGLIHNAWSILFIGSYFARKEYQKRRKETKKVTSSDDGSLKRLFCIIKKAVKANINITIVFAAGILLISNCIYTFSGFVAYTSNERSACSTIEYIQNSDLSYEELKGTLSQSALKNAMDQLPSIKNGNERCKSIQQFYVETLVIIGLAGLLLWLVNRRQNSK